MSDREKNLLGALVFLAVIIITLLGVSKYQENVTELREQRDQLTAKKMIYESSPGLKEALSEECQWILENEPDQVEYAKGMGVLESLLETTSETYGLEVKAPKVTPIEDEGGIYRRVEAEITLKGTQDQVTRWLVEMHAPKDFRAVSSMRMIKSSADELVECQVVVEQKIVEKTQ